MGFKTSLKSAEGHQLIANLASAFGIDEQNADTAVEALDRELRARIERNMLSRGGVADVLSLVTQPAAASALSEPRDLASPNLAENGNHILELLWNLNKEEGTTLILVTHDEALAARSDRRIYLSDGRIVRDES